MGEAGAGNPRNGPSCSPAPPPSLPHDGGMDQREAPPGYYTTRDVARALGTTPGAVRLLVHRGRLQRSGGTERYPWYATTDVAALVANRQARAAA